MIPQGLRLVFASMLALLFHGVLLFLPLPERWQTPPRLPPAERVTVSLAAAPVLPEQEAADKAPEKEKAMPEAVGKAREKDREQEEVRERGSLPAPVVRVRPHMVKKRPQQRKVRPKTRPLPPRETQEHPSAAAAVPVQSRTRTASAPTAAGVRRARPLYRVNPPPEYPALARRRNWQGTVQVLVRVNAGGALAAAGIRKSSGYPLLDRAALAAVRKWRFAPGTINGRPVESEVIVPIHFELQ